MSPGRDVVKVSAAYKACRGIGNKKPTLAVPERVVIIQRYLVYRQSPKKDAPVLLFKSLYPNDCSKDQKSSDVHPKRGNCGLIFPESSSLPGRFFLGLSEEVCPEA